MKRFLTSVALLAVMLVSIFASVAQARWSDPIPVPWHRVRVWNVAAGTTPSYFNVNGPSPDTLWNSIAASKVDTSGVFTLEDADYPTGPQMGVVTTANDSIPFAYLTLVSDSTVAALFKGSTVAIQANWSPGPPLPIVFGASVSDSKAWTTLITYTGNATDSLHHWQIPFYNTGIKAAAVTASEGEVRAFGTGASVYTGLQRGWNLAPKLRVIVTGGASAVVPACRMFLIKYRDPANNQSTTKGNF